MAQVSGVPVSFINVSERERALAFYTGTLGLAVRSSDAFGDFLAVDGGLIRLTALPDYKAGPHPVFGWNVADIEAAVRRLSAQGVAFSIYEGMGQDAAGIWTAPDGDAKVAWFADPDGNVLSLAQA
ncbi:VOC family protein [Phenylobacterium sp. J426]|uniref:VOC family protein n=1 Tax=Phenylobacterium sp. J426 TaxID=2898439 RepID=UPI0021513678|nr:VOC family protein [Phenylobacterium sp. J426]MCR5875049.1 VOC family protein [Phenylobacterium sp. J426]